MGSARTTLLFAFFLGLASLPPLAAAAGPDSDLDSYVLFASETIRSRGLRVLDGNVGVNTGDLEIRRELDAPLSQIAAPNIRLFTPLTCGVGELFANNPLDSGLCGPATSFGTSILPAGTNVRTACGFPPRYTCNAGRSVFVGAGETVELAPGAYGDVLVRGATGNLGTLVFLGGGEYVFCSLRATRRTRLIFDAPTVLKVAGDMRIGDRSFSGPGADIAAKDIQIFVLGERVTFRQRAEVHATICAPDSRANLGQRVTLEGRLVARTIRVDRRTIVGPSGSIGLASTTTSTTTTSTTSTSTTSTTVLLCGNGRVDTGETCDPPGSFTCPPGSPAGAFVQCTAACLCPGQTPTTSSTVRSTTTTSSSSTSSTSTSSSSSSTSTSTSTTSSTTLPAVCGNGVREQGEACDAPDFGDATCPGGSVAGAFLDCVDSCTRIDTSSCPGPQVDEICGNCVDDDGNGATDFEDAACCAQLRTFPMALSRARIRPLVDGTSRLRVRARLARAGLARVDPTTQDVLIQIRPQGGPDLLCAQIPATHIARNRTSRKFKFKDRVAMVTSARGITRMQLRIRRDGSVRFRARGKQVALPSPQAGSLQVTVGFLGGPAGSTDNRCSTVTQTFRSKPSGALRSP